MMGQTSKTAVRKKRALIIAVWIAFLVVMGFLLVFYINKSHHEKAKKELLEQTDIVSQVFPSIVENDFYTVASSRSVMLSKLKALSFELEKYEDLESASTLLKDFVRLADIEGLVIFDKDGRLLFGSSEDPVILDYADSAQYILMDESYKHLEEYYEFTDETVPVYLSGLYFGEYSDISIWGIGDRWLLVIKDTKSEEESDLYTYFDWKNALQSITIGRTGFLLALHKNDDRILSCPDDSLRGLPPEELGLTSEDLSKIRNTDDIVTVKIGGKNYYASKLNLGVLLLALMPFDDIKAGVISESVMVFVLLLIITGICTFYALLHAGDVPEEENEDKKKKRFWNKLLSGKIKVLAVLAIVVVFILGICLEFLQTYADNFRYCLSTVNRVTAGYYANTFITDELKDWFDGEYLTKCNIAKSILDHVDEEVTWDYLNGLSEDLGVKSIFLYDRDGNIVITNSDYDRLSIQQDSPFYPLLQGRPYIIGESGLDELSDEYLQMVGVSLKDQNMKSNGAILIAADAKALETISSNFDYKNLFELADLTNDTSVAVIDENTMAAEYMAEVNNNTLIDETITGALIDSTWMQEHSDGNMYVLQNKYYASIMNGGGKYFMVMRPVDRLETRRLLTILCTTCAAILYMLLLWVVSCIGRNRKLVPLDNKEEKIAAPESDISSEDIRRKDDVIGMLNSFIDKKKPLFEERWPEDSKKWKEKTSGERFSFILKITLVVVLLCVFVYAFTAGENSFWYFCIRGKWDKGLNIYSVISCIVCICLLIVLKMVIHKILFLTARAVGPKGETICHLMNSFSSYFLFFAGIFLCLYLLGVNLKTLSLTGGVAGVVFGIGCQNIVADILAGIFMTFEGVVHAGDMVMFNGKRGIVHSIGVRTTTLRWFNEDTIVRNNDFKNFINLPSMESERITTTINIDLSESLGHVESILEKELPVIQEHLCSITKSEVQGPTYLGVEQFQENYIVLSFAILCEGRYLGLTLRNLNRELKMMCERNNIKLAMTQVVLHSETD